MDLLRNSTCCNDCHQESGSVTDDRTSARSGKNVGNAHMASRIQHNRDLSPSLGNSQSQCLIDPWYSGILVTARNRLLFSLECKNPWESRRPWLDWRCCSGVRLQDLRSTVRI